MQNKYPFNRVWTKISDFMYYPIPGFVDRLYRNRQMEEMWLNKFKSENNYEMVKQCMGNIKYLDAKIAYEEDQRDKKYELRKQERIKNKSLKSK